MGRVTEFIDFINREKMPSVEEQQSEFHYISITENLKKIRKKYRRVIKK